MNCKILKLRSGEDIICNLVQKSKLKYECINPYMFKYTTLVNIVTGVPIELTTIKDWLGLCASKTIIIPSNHIVSVITPSKESKDLYVSELKSHKELKKLVVPHLLPSVEVIKDIVPITKKTKKEDILNDESLEALSKMFNDMINMSPEEREKLEQEYNANGGDETFMTPQDAYNEAFPPRKRKSFKNIPMIQMSLIFPPEVMIDLMESGILNVTDMKRIAKEVKKKMKFTGDERHRPDFGNKLTDWNSNPNSDDYK